MTKEKAAFLICIFALLMVFLGCVGKPRAPEHIRILFTSDTQGNFTPCGCVGGPRGGMERRSTAIAQARAEVDWPVILVDTGNFMTGLETQTERIKADYVVKAMAMMGYDAVNVGRMDARRPRLAVNKFSVSEGGIPLTSAAFTYNDPETGERRFSYPSRIIVQRDGFKIGIVGHPLDDLDQSKLGVENVFSSSPEELYELLDRVYVEDGAGLIILLTDFKDSRKEAEIAASRFSLAGVVIACLLYTSPSPRD